jgi:SLT domain-containing protein
MASRIAEAYVQITPRIDGVATQLNRQLSTEMGTAGDQAGAALASGTATGFGSRINGLLKPALIGAGLLATAALGNFLKDSVAAASDFAEQGAAVGAVFGDAATIINQFASGSATALGQSSTQVLEASKQFGIYGQAAGLAGEENAKFSTDLVTLATDLASFNNTSVDDAILALGSGLRGEAEPLRRYGVLLDDATLRAKALEMGLIETTKEALSPQNKVLAANAVIMEQTSIQQGDFERTSAGLANQQRILQANMAELGITVGTALLPVMTTITTFINTNVVPAFTTIFEGIKNNIPTIATFVGVLAGLLTIFNAIKIATGLWSVAQGILNAVMAINPFTLLAVAIAVLIAAIVYIATQTTFFQETWEAMTTAIGEAWTTVTTVITDTWNSVTTAIGDALNAVYTNVIKPALDGIGAAFTFLYDNFIWPFYLGVTLFIGLWAASFEAFYNYVVKPVIEAIGWLFNWLWENGIKPVIEGAIGAFVFLGEGLRFLENLVLEATRAMARMFIWLWENGIKPALDAIGGAFVFLWENVIKLAIDAIVGYFVYLWEDGVKPALDLITGAFTWLWENGIKPVIGFMLGGFNTLATETVSIFDGIRNGIVNLFNGLVAIIKVPINGVIGLLNGMIGGLNNIKIDIPDWVPEWGGKKIGFNLSKIPQLADGGYVDRPTTALIGEAGPEVVVPLNRFEQMMGLNGAKGQTINYYAAPNQSLDAEQALLQAVKRARVITGW